MRSKCRSSLLIVLALIATTAVAPTARAAPTTSPTRAPSLRTVPLITGDSASIIGSGPSARVVLDAPRGGSVLRFGGRIVVVPSTARPYVGTILDASLFDITTRTSDLTRLPVTLRLVSSSAHPTAPGLVIVSRSGTDARGYLDLSQARAFGDALAAQRQHDAGHPSTAILGGITKLAASVLSPPAHPEYPQVTLIIRGVDAQGRPAESGFVGIVNVDDGSRAATLVFLDRGQANVSVPRGHYSLIGEIDSFSTPRPRSWVVPVADFTVNRDRQVYVVDARRATVSPSVSTPRPATEQILTLRWDRAAGLVSVGFAGFFDRNTDVYVAPTARSAYGRTDWVTEWWLLGTPTTGVPYAYYASFHDAGAVPSDLHRVVPADRVATIRSSYLATGHPGTGAFGRSSVYPFEGFPAGLVADLALPTDRVEYVYNDPGAVWAAALVGPPTRPNAFNGVIVVDGQRVYPPGSTQTARWLDGALAPGLPVTQNGDPGYFCLACRNRSRMSIAMYPVTDSDPGHFGAPSSGVRFRFWRDGTLITDLPDVEQGFYDVPSNPAVYRLRVDTNLAASRAQLPTRTSTDVTFRSAAGQGAPIPPGGFCPLYGPCTVLPLLAVRVPLSTDLDGVVPRGPLTITFTVGHIQGATPSTITAAGLSYAVNGHDYQNATVTALGGGRYRATVSAPAGSQVSLRVTATDANGGSIEQTTADAYRVADSLGAQS